MTQIENLMQKMQQMIKMQENILIEFENLVDPTIGGIEQKTKFTSATSATSSAASYKEITVANKYLLLMPVAPTPEVIPTADIHINVQKIECIERYYFIMSIINTNLQKILDLSKKESTKLQLFSTKIRSQINKTRQMHSSNKFINIFNGQIDRTEPINRIGYSRDTYESIQKSYELNHNTSSQIDYTLIRTVKLTDGFYVDIPTTDTLDSLQSIFYWFNGNKKHEHGIYMTICRDFSIQVPFPDLIGKHSTDFKHKSVACKYRDIDICNAKQIDLSKKYGTELRNCNYLHHGESFIKIGSDFRCPNLPSFGCHSTLESDINNISLQDIKILLMNASSDLLLVLLWYEHHKNLGKIIFNNLDKL